MLSLALQLRRLIFDTTSRPTAGHRLAHTIVAAEVEIGGLLFQSLAQMMLFLLMPEGVD